MFTLNCKGRLLVIDEPIVMGIINVTPDSFYDKSRVGNVDAALRQAENMIRDGAVILDIGGQSTRPGSERITEDEELKRVIPVIQAIHKAFPESFLSVDTYYSRVAKDGLMAGADIINDVSGGKQDEKIIDIAAELKAPYVLMHEKEFLHKAKEKTHYENVTKEVLDYFIWRTDELSKKGIRDIIIDPGFGFGKDVAQNFELVKNLSVFRVLEKPLLFGISRKSMIWKTLKITAGEALNGTTVLNTIGLLNGASILRVHDVKETVEAIKLVKHCM